MGNISFVKDKSLYMSGIASVLNEEFQDHTFQLYDYEEMWEHKKRICNYTDMLIVEFSKSVDLKEITNYKKMNVKVAIWTFSEIERKRLLELMKIGIDGYLYGDMELYEFRTAINEILNGFKYIHPYFSSIILNEYSRLTNINYDARPVNLLTKREREILERLSSGYQNVEIASQLCISDKTVKNHVSSILKKLKVKDRTSAVILAIKNNWVSI
mgnify:CR=1 FL=1